MRRSIGWAIRVVIILLASINMSQTSASSATVVISQIQLDDAVSASNEFVEVYNNSDTDIDITNWCLYYATGSSSTNGNKLGCFLPSNEQTYIFLPARSYAFAISTQLATNIPSLGSDLKFSATLSGNSGHVRLIDDQGTVVDKVGWGSAISPETMAVTAPTTNKILGRLADDEEELQDTDDNSKDITQVSPRLSYQYGNIYEVVDACTNITGIQGAVPSGYNVDVEGVCTAIPVDVCSNIDGVQESIPIGFEFDDAGLCQPDVCSNIVDLQIALPAGYTYNSNDDCVSVPLLLVISELLPNPDGDDSGQEFIELYNPNDQDILLGEYEFYVGTNSTVLYHFPNDTSIKAHGYRVIYNDEINFTLVNTSGSVHLQSIDGISVDTTETYVDAKSGSSWALIDGVWNYTNQPTPNAENQPSIVDDVEEIITGLKPCPSNQYRNPETNRCRLIVTTGSVLVPCKDGQYRSEITNRCRSIAADSSALSQCNENQYRNPETNRCKLIESSSTTLTPCADGQERNPDTNRCRNVASKVPDAGFAVEPIPDSNGTNLGWLAVVGVCIVALLYGLWEWRFEVFRLIRRVRGFFHVTK